MQRETKQPRGSWERFGRRIHGKRIERWESGELDDEGFERAQRAWARKVVLLCFGALFPVVTALDWFAKRRSFEDMLERTAIYAGLLGVFGIVAAFQASNFAQYGARNLVLTRRRERIERNPAQNQTDGAPRPGSALAFFGSYRRSTRYANRILVMGVVLALVGFAVAALRGGAQSAGSVLLLALGAGVSGWGLFWHLDRRVYVDISREGIWCRAWGKQRLRFDEFKAVYARQNNLLDGVMLVPRAPAELRRVLSWMGRYSLRSGGGVAAHAGTLPLWATEIGVDRDALLVALQAEIVRR